MMAPLLMRLPHPQEDPAAAESVTIEFNEAGIHKAPGHLLILIH